MHDGKLFKRGIPGILFRCLSGDEAMEVITNHMLEPWRSTKEEGESSIFEEIRK